MRISRLTIFPLIAVATISCSGSLNLNSSARPPKIVIDGRQSEWQGALTFVEKKNVSLGISNDDDFLYVCLASTDWALRRQMLMMGFTLWLDPEGGNDKKLGIRFPIGLVESGFWPGRGRGDGLDRGATAGYLSEALAELEIIDPVTHKAERFGIGEINGIETALGDPSEMLVYEIKVPLRVSSLHPYAVGVDARERIGVGLETKELDRKAMRQQMGDGGFGGGRRPGGFAGRGGGRGGFGGRPAGGGRGQMTSPFELWLSVQLSSGNQASSTQIMREKDEQPHRCVSVPQRSSLTIDRLKA